MNQTEAEIEERRILSAQESSFKGSAIVRLDSIQLNDEHSRDFDKKNLERLKRIFNTEGCLRLDKENHVPVLVDKDEYQHAEKYERDGHGEPYPRLAFRAGALKCLHGRHRLLAAYSYLPPVDQWWVVDVYVDANEYLQNYIGQDYSNSSNITDGEIWRHIRVCNKSGDSLGERKWWSRLSKGKDQDLHQLLRHSGFCHAFDQLIDIPGLWVGLKLGTLHRFLTLKCDEELLRYLHRIHEVWSGIFTGFPDLMKATDYTSVQALQLRAPMSSRKDFLEIKDGMDNEVLFSLVKEKRTRGQILHNIHATKQMIPSIFTFFEDLKYLEPLANAMKKLIGPIKRSSGTSVCREFQHAFTVAHIGHGPFEVQVNEGTFRSVHGSLQKRMEVGYRQLWMYAMRHFPELVSLPPRKENGQSKPLVREIDLSTLIEFADLAHRFGFDSREIQVIRSENPNYEIALAFLRSSRPVEFYEYNQEFLDAHARTISEILRSFKKQQAPGPVAIPTMTTKSYLEKDRLLRRCGRPFESDFDRDKSCLFLDNFHQGRSQSHAEDISSFFVRASFYSAFFGSDDLESGDSMDSIMEDEENRDQQLREGERERERRQELERRQTEVLRLREETQRLQEEAEREREREEGIIRERQQAEALQLREAEAQRERQRQKDIHWGRQQAETLRLKEETLKQQQAESQRVREAERELQLEREKQQAKRVEFELERKQIEKAEALRLREEETKLIQERERRKPEENDAGVSESVVSVEITGSQDGEISKMKLKVFDKIGRCEESQREIDDLGAIIGAYLRVGFVCHDKRGQAVPDVQAYMATRPEMIGLRRKDYFWKGTSQRAEARGEDTRDRDDAEL